MTKRRDKGSGSVFFRQRDRRYVARIDLGWTTEGKRLRRERTAKTKIEANRLLREMQRAVEDHGALASPTSTVKAYLEQWVAQVRVKPTTAANYRYVIRNHLIPALGRHKLAALQPPHVRAMLDDMERRGLSASTTSGAHRVLRAALSDAVNDGLVPRNAAKHVTPPQPKPADVTLTPEQVFTLLHSLAERGDPLAARWVVALFLGLRQGEALGMEWERLTDTDDGPVYDLSWQLQRIPWRHGCDGTCHVTRPGSCPQRVLDVRSDFDHRQVDGALCLTRPKSAAGVRLIPVPQFVHAALMAHSERRHGLIFTRDDGRPIDPSDDSKAWHAALDLAGLPPVKLHAARHTTATLLLEQGVDAKVVMHILGQSSVLVARGYQSVSTKVSRGALEGITDPFAGR